MAKRAQKPHTPETTLQRIVSALVRGEMHRAVVDALKLGPLDVPTETYVRAVVQQIEEVDKDVGSEMLAFLYTLVRNPAYDSRASLRKGITFSAKADDGGAISLAVDAGIHDAALLQLVMLVQLVGVRSIRECNCGRLFVKTYRRLFCSEQCQHRVYMKQKRENERLRRARASERRRRQRQEGESNG